MKIILLFVVALGLSACGSCLDPTSKLSDCPTWLPGHAR